MIKQEILNKAIYIQFPYNNESYKDYSSYNKIINLLPIIKNKNDILYNNIKDDAHHYTTKYHRHYVLPLLNNLFNFNFDLNDFNIKKIISDKADFSYLEPKHNYNYIIEDFQTNTKIEGNYNILLKPTFFKTPAYRSLYRFPHSCSKIINKDIKNNKKIFISGDSQMIPDIPVLASYYKEVWYFDNRTGREKYHMIQDKIISFNYTFKNIIFDDVLIELYKNDFSWYTDVNLR